MSETVAVILAAGEGKRMGIGVPKALLEYENGKSFLGQLASVMGKAGCSPIAVVGAMGAEVEANHPQLNVVRNDRWADGQWSSARMGIRAALEMGAETVLVQPVDMPFIRASTVTQLLRGFTEGDARIPTFEGAPGHPLLLTRAAAERILSMQVGSLEEALAALDVRRVAVKDPAVLLDVNTPEAHQRLFERAPQVAPPPKRRQRAAAMPAPHG